MNYQEILDLKKKMDFNLTEHETLVRLVDDASRKGGKARADMSRLLSNAAKIASRTKEGSNWFQEDTLKDIDVPYSTAVGIDGGFQTVGGVGGIWYAPMSVARVVFENSKEPPKVDIFWAGVEEIIEESAQRNPNTVAALMMLVGETKALMDWGAKALPAVVFIDGPIVDPPFHTETMEDYVTDRCDAIRKCLAGNVLIGCVKRSRDRFYSEYLTEVLPEPLMKQYPSDQHFLAFMFGHIRSQGITGALYTEWIDLSKKPFFSNYSSRGIHVWCCFFQKDRTSPILRIDLPFLEGADNNLVKGTILQAVKAVSEWTYPGQGYPLPVFLADSKCKIRDGCAEVLYEEILTRSTSTDPVNQIILTQLR